MIESLPVTNVKKQFSLLTILLNYSTMNTVISAQNVINCLHYFIWNGN